MPNLCNCHICDECKQPKMFHGPGFCNKCFREPKRIFWSKVEKSISCWNWTGFINSEGYGMFRKTGAHRYSWEIHFGNIPEDKCVCHTCDNRKCVRPQHLWLGYKFENTADMMLKGRGARGERQGNHKLSDEQVKAIRNIYSHKFGDMTRIAKMFGVSHSEISRVIHRKNWTHI